MLDWLTGKKVRLNLSLNPACVEALDAIADHTHLTRSEILEYLTQGRLTLHGDSATTCFRATAEGIVLDAPTAPSSPQQTDASPSQAAPPQADEVDQFRSQVQQLNQQVASLQTALTQAQQAQSTQESEYAALEQQSQQRQQQIATLQEQLDQLRAMATIGESITNRWQRQNYSC